MKESPSYLTHGSGYTTVSPLTAVADVEDDPIKPLKRFEVEANLLLAFWHEWNTYSLHDQLSLSVPEHAYNTLSYAEQLSMGCGSLRLNGRSESDRDYCHLIRGAEFLTPLFDFARSLGYTPCKPMIRYLAPKTCLPYHIDDVGIRFHVVLETDWKSFFVIQDKIYRMPTTGMLYTLKTSVFHTAVNANLNKPRIHFTFSGFKDKD